MGEEEFKRQALRVKEHGAAVVVMAFDEEGQAADEASKVSQPVRQSCVCGGEDVPCVYLLV